MRYFALVVILASLMTACSPEVGSDGWCKSLKDKNKSDWSSQEAKDFAKHCLFKQQNLYTKRPGVLTVW